jgi:hypothetical protein
MLSIKCHSKSLKNIYNIYIYIYKHLHFLYFTKHNVYLQILSIQYNNENLYVLEQ